MLDNVVNIERRVGLSSALKLNAHDLEAELSWCEKVIETRFQLYFNRDCQFSSIQEVSPPSLECGASNYSNFLRQYNLNFFDRLLLALAIIPFVKPKSMDCFLCVNELSNRPFTEFGCVEVEEGRLYASAETVAFIYGADSVETRLKVQSYIQSKQNSVVFHVLDVQSNIFDPLSMRASIRLTEEYLHFFTTGESFRPEASREFPAERIQTQQGWSDLVFSEAILEQLKGIQQWANHRDRLDKLLGERNRSGYRVLFHGPPGTGKTFTAGILGNTIGLDVYKVDLSAITSKFIGETEKNLEKLFSFAENRSWILFFDEADALFGKRVKTASSNDQFANQTVAYLLQRIENYNGIAILASNHKDNIDDAFMRRFETAIHFTPPDYDERLILWQKAVVNIPNLDPLLDLTQLANEFCLTGAEIMNVIRAVLLQCLSKDVDIITQQAFVEGIKSDNAKNHNSPSDFRRGNEGLVWE